MSDMPVTPENVTWQVVAQVPAQGQASTGQYGPGHLITAQLPSGSTFQVFVPNGDYTIDKVRAALAAKAATVANIDKLSSN
jgi:hypothetical protein